MWCQEKGHELRGPQAHYSNFSLSFPSFSISPPSPSACLTSSSIFSSSSFYSRKHRAPTRLIPSRLTGRFTPERSLANPGPQVRPHLQVGLPHSLISNVYRLFLRDRPSQGSARRRKIRRHGHIRQPRSTVPPLHIERPRLELSPLLLGPPRRSPRLRRRRSRPESQGRPTPAEAESKRRRWKANQMPYLQFHFPPCT